MYDKYEDRFEKFHKYPFTCNKNTNFPRISQLNPTKVNNHSKCTNR